MVPSLIRRILALAYGCVSAIVLAICIFPESIARIYTNIPGLITACIPAMLVMATSYSVAVGGQVFFLAVSGTGSTKTAFRLELIALAAYTIYCSVIIGMMKSDVALCWTAEHVYSLVLLICSWWYMRSGRWKNRSI